MQNDNTTPMTATEYDKKISNTIPYYEEFNIQIFDIIRNCNFKSSKWLDLGCGTGSMEEQAFVNFEDIHFIIVDPSSQMLDQAKMKLKGRDVQYICSSSEDITFVNEFEIVTAIQAHHYLKEEARAKATENAYRALKQDGIYLTFENVVPEDEYVKNKELSRWGTYQVQHGKTTKEANDHLSRCGVNYFPITVGQHIELMKTVGFRYVHVFWYSYMQMGIYGIK